MMAYLIPLLGVGRGIYYSIFHAISAFCNAGFDLMGYQEEYISFVNQVDVPWINIPIMLLIVIGGIGFLVWEDICEKKWNIRKYNFHTKLVLTTTFILIFGGAALFYLFEHQRLFADFSPAGKVFASFFSAITPRTAGFNTIDLTSLSGPGQVITVVLMLIGGSPGSTAGGLKTTTVMVLLVSAISVFNKKNNAHCFGRTISVEIIKTAGTILMMYLVLFLTGAVTICCVENVPMNTALFETASAIGTVGLSMGITPSLGLASRLILIGLMYFGRVGSLTFIFAAISKNQSSISRYPQEKITVG